MASNGKGYNRYRFNWFFIEISKYINRQASKKQYLLQEEDNVNNILAQTTYYFNDTVNGIINAVIIPFRKNDRIKLYQSERFTGICSLFLRFQVCIGSGSTE